MLKNKKEIKFQKVDGELLYQDDYINVEFVMDYLDVKKTKAFEIIKKSNKLLLDKYGMIPVISGKTTLSIFYELMGLEGKF